MRCPHCGRDTNEVAKGTYKMVKASLTVGTTIHSGQALFWKNYEECEITTEPNGKRAGWATAEVIARSSRGWLKKILQIPGRRVYGTIYFWMQLADSETAL